MKPTLAAVQEHLELSDAELRKMVLREPQIIGYSFESNIKPTLAAVQEHLELSDAELRKMVLSMLAIIGYSFEANNKPKLGWLQDSLGLDKKQLLLLVQKQGTLFGSSLQNTLIPNLAFYKACFAELPHAEFLSKVVASPRQLTISHKRLQHRAAQFDAHGIQRSLLWGKAQFTNEQMDAWVAKRGAS